VCAEFVRILEGKKSLGRPSCRYNNNITMDLKELGYEDVDRIYLVQKNSNAPPIRT
jgi:hypothetical protein